MRSDGGQKTLDTISRKFDTSIFYRNIWHNIKHYPYFKRKKRSTLYIETSIFRYIEKNRCTISNTTPTWRVNNTWMFGDGEGKRLDTIYRNFDISIYRKNRYTISNTTPTWTVKSTGMPGDGRKKSYSQVQYNIEKPIIRYIEKIDTIFNTTPT